MNRYFEEYVATAKFLANNQNLDWELDVDDTGTVSKNTRWN